MADRDFKLLVITPEGNFPEEVKWIDRLFEAGLSCLHLRKPGWSFQQLLKFAKQIDTCYYSNIMVHYEEALLHEGAFRGVHYRVEALPAIKPAFTVSCGLHGWEQLAEAENRLDYAFVSPFFRSISKERYPANPALLNIPAGMKREKAIALGGITAGNLQRIISLGLGGAAVLGSIWQSGHPLRAFKELNRQVKQQNSYG
jgi:thiamine-phosphate pyrophosphorylase